MEKSGVVHSADGFPLTEAVMEETEQISQALSGPWTLFSQALCLLSTLFIPFPEYVVASFINDVFSFFPKGRIFSVFSSDLNSQSSQESRL